VAYVSRVVDAPVEAGRLVAAIRGAQLVPSAIELDAPPDGPTVLTVLLEGTPTGVESRAAGAAQLLGSASVSGTPPPGWSEYPWRDGDIGLKLTAALSVVPRLVETGRRHRLAIRGSAGSGVLYAGLPGPADPGTVAATLAELRAVAEHAVVLTAPAPVRDRIDLWGPVGGLELMRRVKRQFDPDARLAPGRFVGGI
jgi:glycolate oxidase FAD binding subunit